MKPSVIVSKQDPAGMNIRDVLVELHGFNETTETFNRNPVYAKQGIKLYTIEERTIDANGIDQQVEGDWIIFATRHQAASGKKCFCVHVPGNWAKAEAGGEDRRLCRAVPAAMKEALRKIDGIYGGDEFDISQECTHHGPAIDKPCLFIEIGSTEAEWTRHDAGEFIANVVNYLCMNKPSKYKEVMVIGGGHYSQAGTKLMSRTEYAAGHICPKHALEHLDEDMLKQAIEKNGDNFDMIVLDWKGLGTEKARVMEIIESLGLKHQRYQKMSKEDPDQ